MLDPLPRIEEIEDFDPEIAAIFAQIFDLPPRAIVEFAHRAVGVGRIDMVDDPQRCSGAPDGSPGGAQPRSEEHTSELQSLMRISYAVFCLNKKNQHISS